MSNTQLKTVAGSAVVAAENDPGTFPGMLKAYKGEIARALPKHINADRMCRIALTCFRLTPKLAECQPASVFAALIQASQVGLEPGPNGRAYLIPYQGECQFVPGWKGLVELANRTGRASVWTGAVFEGDDFDYRLGDSPMCEHRPRGEDDPEKLVYTYAVGRVKGNDWPVIEVWPNTKIVKHRNRYNKVGRKHYSYDNWEMYARKVPLLQVLKYMPASPELETAMALSDTFDSGERQGITIDGALANAFEPPVPTGTTTDAGKDGGDDGRPTLPEDTVHDRLGNAATIEKLDEAAAEIDLVVGADPQARLVTFYKERKAALK